MITLSIADLGLKAQSAHVSTMQLEFVGFVTIRCLGEQSNRLWLCPSPDSIPCANSAVLVLASQGEHAYASDGERIWKCKGVVVSDPKEVSKELLPCLIKSSVFYKIYQIMNHSTIGQEEFDGVMQIMKHWISLYIRDDFEKQ